MLPYSGFGAYNIKGCTIEIQEFLDKIKSVADEMELSDFLKTGIDTDATPNLFICDLEDSEIENAFPGLPRTDIESGIRKTLTRFQDMAPRDLIKF